MPVTRSYTGPKAGDSRLPSLPWGRILWGASLAAFVVVLIVTLLVALDL
jgi:hypothetical protein